MVRKPFLRARRNRVGTSGREMQTCRPGVLILCTPLILVLTITNPAAAVDLHDDPSFDVADRVICQTRIETIRWSHRIWPTVNPHPKPTLNQIMSEEQIRSKVIEALRMETALKDLFGVEITDAMLQAELDRMVRYTKAPDRLRELFDALDNDPAKIAECMARPFLVEQRLRNRTSWDDRLHGELGAQVEAALLEPNDPALRNDPVGETQRVIYLHRDGTSPIPEPDFDNDIVEPVILGSEEYKRIEARLVGSSTRLNRKFGLRETESAFIYEEVLSHTPDRLEVDQTMWRKTDFNTWWDENAERWSAIARAAIPIGMQLPKIADGIASDDFEHPDFTPPDTWLVGRNIPGRVQHSAIWTGTEMITWGGYSDDDTKTGDRYDPVTDQWIETSIIDAPLERRGHVAMWTGTEMLVWGGYSGGWGYLGTGGRYSPATNSWGSISTIDAPEGRTIHTAVWTGDEMIVWGGLDGTGQHFYTGGRYDPTTDLWVPTNTSGAPSGRINHTAVWTGNEMIVWGGREGSTEFDDGGRYDPTTDLWTPTSTTGTPVGRYYHGAVWTGDEMIVWGGSTDVNPYQTNTGGRYDPATNTWQATSTVDAPDLRTWVVAEWTGDEMIVWGGSTDVNPYLTNTGGRYDPATNTWQATSTVDAPDRRAFVVAEWSGTEMIVWGGQGSNNAYLDTGGRYDPTTDLWAATSPTDAPGARRQHTAVWTGTEMIIWGGYDGGDPFNTGGRYDPVADQWVATHLGYSPTPRSGHTAVWTGSEMFVWGGSADSVRLNTGGRYDPVIDGWTATTTTNAPSARAGHTAVWTGTEVIVWGGYDDGHADTGGSYDPVLEAWVATDTTSPPSGREHHTAVWTGSEMIVWGGEDNLGELNTGGRYDPTAYSWTETTGTDAPFERIGHTAIWTGSEMIVWGGILVGFELYSGGRYDPAADHWAATSGSIAPLPRWNHTAVWTGSEMIIWGGNKEAISLDTGGRYLPSSDTWSRTDTDTAPVGRSKHSVVWTGSEMIIWGGWDQALNHLDNGGRYDPATDLWEITSTADAPGARISHTAVWTGWEMIVWGGFPSSASLGLYYPYGDLIRLFFDGFETENTLRWSDTYAP